MTRLVDSFWRALAYCLLPRVLWLSVLPLLLTGALAAGLSYFFWESALDAVSQGLEGWGLTTQALGWLDGMGAQGLRIAIVPLIVVVLTVPVLVVVSLLIVAWLMAPRLAELVAKRRFPALQRRGSGSLIANAASSLAATALALLMLVVSMPLWLVPPLLLVLPPLIWGWLSYRVMALDALSSHATFDERRGLMRTHRWSLLGIGIATAWLGAAPALVWAVSASLLVLAPFLLVASVWVYTMVFAFSALWFSHYLMAELQALRGQDEEPVPATDLRSLNLPSHPAA